MFLISCSMWYCVVWISNLCLLMIRIMNFLLIVWRLLYVIIIWWYMFMCCCCVRCNFLWYWVMRWVCWRWCRLLVVVMLCILIGVICGVVCCGKVVIVWLWLKVSVIFCLWVVWLRWVWCVCSLLWCLRFIVGWVIGIMLGLLLIVWLLIICFIGCLVICCLIVSGCIRSCVNSCLMSGRLISCSRLCWRVGCLVVRIIVSGWCVLWIGVFCCCCVGVLERCVKICCWFSSNVGKVG